MATGNSGVGVSAGGCTLAVQRTPHACLETEGVEICLLSPLGSRLAADTAGEPFHLVLKRKRPDTQAW